MHIPPRLSLDKEELVKAAASAPPSRPGSVVSPNPLAAAAVAPMSLSLPSSGTKDWNGDSGSTRRSSLTKEAPLTRRRLRWFVIIAAALGVFVGGLIAGLASYFSGVIAGKKMSSASNTPANPSPAPNPYSSIQLFVNLQTFDNLDQAVVTFVGLEDASAMTGLWIGLFRAENFSAAAIPPMPFPASPPWLASAPISWVMIESLASPMGLFPVALINSYEPYLFALFSGGISNPKLLVKSPPLTPKSFPPLRGRLSRSQDDPTEVRLTWHSAFNTGSPRVYFGDTSVATNGGNYSSMVAGTAYTYTQQQLVNEPAKTIGWLDPHYFVSATLSGLTPGRRYYYVYGSTTAGFSQEQSFIAPLSAGQGTTPGNNLPPAKWLLYGDTGVAPADSMAFHWMEPFSGQTTRQISEAITAAQVAGAPYTGALHIGDLAYSTGYSSKWVWFEELFHKEIGSRLPVSVVYGNHERATPGTGSIFGTDDSGGEAGIPMAIRFPSIGFNGNAQAFAATGYYAFREAQATFVFLNSELPMGPGSNQYTWADTWLSMNFNRQVTPWLFFVWHRPAYISSAMNMVIETIEPLLLRWMVDGVLNGHQHYATVSCGVFNGTCLTQTTTPSVASDGWDGTRHVVVGNGGQNLYPLPDPDETAPWVEWQAATYGYSDLTIVDATKATIRYLAAADGRVLQTITMTRQYPRLPVPLQ